MLTAYFQHHFETNQMKVVFFAFFIFAMALDLADFDVRSIPTAKSKLFAW